MPCLSAGVCRPPSYTSKSTIRKKKKWLRLWSLSRFHHAVWRSFLQQMSHITGVLFSFFRRVVYQHNPHVVCPTHSNWPDCDSDQVTYQYKRLRHTKLCPLHCCVSGSHLSCRPFTFLRSAHTSIVHDIFWVCHNKWIHRQRAVMIYPSMWIHLCKSFAWYATCKWFHLLFWAVRSTFTAQSCLSGVSFWYKL